MYLHALQLITLNYIIYIYIIITYQSNPVSHYTPNWFVPPQNRFIWKTSSKTGLPNQVSAHQ